MSAVVNPQESIDLSNLRVNTITDGFYTAKMGSIDCIMDANNYFNITKMLKQFGKNIQSFRDKDPKRLDMLLYTYTQLSGQSDGSTNLKLVKNVPKNPQLLGVRRGIPLEIVSAKDIEGYESYPLIMYEINTSLGSPVKGKAKAIQNQVVGVYAHYDIAKEIERWVRFSKPPSSKKGWVYIISCEKFMEDNWYKIGFTTKLNERGDGLQTGCPYKIKIIFSHLCENPQALEAALHRRYENRRGIGEWFKFKDINKCIEYINGL
jgi:hypothetical protein